MDQPLTRMELVDFALGELGPLSLWLRSLNELSEPALACAANEIARSTLMSEVSFRMLAIHSFSFNPSRESFIIFLTHSWTRARVILVHFDPGFVCFGIWNAIGCNELEYGNALLPHPFDSGFECTRSKSHIWARLHN